MVVQCYCVRSIYSLIFVAQILACEQRQQQQKKKQKLVFHSCILYWCVSCARIIKMAQTQSHWSAYQCKAIKIFQKASAIYVQFIHCKFSLSLGNFCFIGVFFCIQCCNKTKTSTAIVCWLFYFGVCIRLNFFVVNFFK